MRQKRLESFADFVCCEPGFLGPGHTIFQSIGPEVFAHAKIIQQVIKKSSSKTSLKILDSLPQVTRTQMGVTHQTGELTMPSNCH